jgi:CBS domain-containing protein
MIAKVLITDYITPLKTSDKGIDALAAMEELKVNHMPIVNNGNFLGLISEFDIYNLNDPEEALGNHTLSLPRIFIDQSASVYDIVKLIGEHNLTLVPVVDSKENYIGSVTLGSLVGYLAKIFSVESPGGIIVLELSQSDYMLSEIAGIVESNDAKVINVFITSYPDSTKLEVALKVNTTEIESILQTFSRYNYVVKAFYTDRQEFFDDMGDRYDELMNYLNIGD